MKNTRSKPRYMTQNNQELETTLARIRHFQKQTEKIREVENNPKNYRFSV